MISELLLIVSAFFAPVAVSFAAEPHAPTSVVVFIDFMIAPIHDKTLTGFRPLAEASFPALPRFNGFVDNTLKHAQRVKATESRIADARQQVRGEVAQAVATPLASRYAHVLLHWAPSKSCRTR